MKKWTSLFCVLLLLAGALSACRLESVAEHESRIQAEQTAGQAQVGTAVSSTALATAPGSPQKQTNAPGAAKQDNATGGTTQRGVPQSVQSGAPVTSLTGSDTASQPQQIRVTLSVTCNAALGHPKLREGLTLPANGEILSGTVVTLKQGQTVFDALKAACAGAGVYLGYQNSAFGKYVKTIGPLSEKDCGAQSGWTYEVGGRSPSKSADAYKLQSGDVVRWNFVTKA